MFLLLFGCTNKTAILQDKINDLNTLSIQLSTDLNKLQIDYNQVVLEKSQLILLGVTKDQTVTTLQNNITALNLQIARKEIELNKMITDYNQLNYDKNLSDFLGLQKDQNYQTRLNDLNSQILIKTYDLNILQSNYRQLQLDKNNLEFIGLQKDQNYQTRLNDLNIQINLLTTQKNNLQLIINDLNSRLIEKTINLNTLQLEYNNLLVANDLNIAELNELQSEINLLTTEKTNLQNSLNIMGVQLMQINAENLEVKTNFNNLLTLYNTKTAELTIFQTKYLNAVAQRDDINNRYLNASVLYRLYGNDMNIYSSFNKNFYYYNQGIKETYSTTMYGEINDYLNILQDCNGCDRDKNKIITRINESVSQTQLLIISNYFNLLPISNENKVRSIVNMVQQIDYFNGDDIRESTGYLYPYQVLYNGIGVCGEKSMLLINLLKNMGYKTAYIDMPNINHATVGIGCTGPYEFHNSGYCYIEPNTPNIISDFNMRGNSYAYDSNLLKYVSIKDTNYIIYSMSDGNIYNATDDYNAQLQINTLYSQNWALWKIPDCVNYYKKKLLWGLFGTEDDMNNDIIYDFCIKNFT